MKPLVIKEIASAASDFCKEKALNLILDFTTNATLITRSTLEAVKDNRCVFQITLDGNREQHNKIKYGKNRDFDAFGRTIDNIKLIQSVIPSSFVAVRINFDAETLNGFDSILKEIDCLDRLRTKVILKKVWQVDEAKIDDKQVYDVISRLFKNNFIVDYNSQVGPCFADRKNEAVINYDGNVFKCTTIASFDEKNAFGHLDDETGKIEWNQSRIESLFSQKINPECMDCPYFPACGGKCKMKLFMEPHKPCEWHENPEELKKQIRTQFEIEYIKNKIIKEYAEK